MKGVILGAGEGRRLLPLTELLPKALCPVGNRPLFDIALERMQTVSSDLAANVHAHRDLMEQHLAERPVHVSVEEHERLGTGGALGKLKEWIDGSPVVVTNCDAITSTDLRAFVEGWDGERIRLLVALAQDKADFYGFWEYAGVCLMPWSAVQDLPARDCDLYVERWRPAHEAGLLELVPTRAAFIDCGTPLRYLAANLTVSGGESVIAPDAEVDGEVEASVVWAGARVAQGEHLKFAIRLDDGRTVEPLAG
jgi:N-acetyl-alpha-D-muramate 1-phosphate uridylyltransferase